MMAGQQVEYQKIDLTLDGTLQKGEISIKSSSVLVNISNTNISTEGVQVKLFKERASAEMGIDEFAVYSKTMSLSNTSVKFDNVAPGVYYLIAINRHDCIFPENIFKVTVVEGKQVKVNGVSILKGAKLRLNSKAKNPYEVVIIEGDGNKKEFIIEAGKSKTVVVTMGNIQVKVKQQSGYIFYPTKDKFDLNITSCEEISSVCFPSGKCD